MTVSTHVLDAVAGTPAPGVPVALSIRAADGSWLPVEEGVTDPDGRLRFAAETTGTVCRLTFGTGRYFADRGVATFYPEVVVTFGAAAIEAADFGAADFGATDFGATDFDATGGHCHVPLLLSPYAYSTYRGS